MNIQEVYTLINGNYENAKGRLMSDRIIEKFLIKFLSDKTMESLNDAVAAGDRETSFRMAHTMKGVAANMAFSDLEAKSSALTEQLRPLTEDADPTLLEDVNAAYKLITDTINGKM